MDTNTLQNLTSLITNSLIDITISNPEKTEALTKIKIRQMELKGTVQYQIEEFTKTQAFHKNVTLEELKKLFPMYFENRFRQAQLHDLILANNPLKFLIYALISAHCILVHEYSS